MAIDESANLAEKRGSYKNFPGSRWSNGMVPMDTLEVLEKDRGISLQMAHELYLCAYRPSAMISLEMARTTSGFLGTVGAPFRLYVNVQQEEITGFPGNKASLVRFPRMTLDEGVRWEQEGLSDNQIVALRQKRTASIKVLPSRYHFLSVETEPSLTRRLMESFGYQPVGLSDEDSHNLLSRLRANDTHDHFRKFGVDDPRLLKEIGSYVARELAWQDFINDRSKVQ